MDEESDLDHNFHGFEPGGIELSQKILTSIERQIKNVSANTRGENKVVIISPESTELLKNPLKYARTIKESDLGGKYKEYIKIIYTNKRKNLIVVEFFGNPDIMREVQKMTTLGSWKVSCYIPNEDTTVSGVISPIDCDLDLEELKPELQLRYQDSDPPIDSAECLVSLERLKRKVRGAWVDSESVKLTFNGKTLPKVAIICENNFYRIRPYVDKPLQCYNCQRLGHTAKSCTAGTRCLVCGGNHKKDDCTVGATPKCANCRGDHTANSNECKYYAVAKRIQTVKAKKFKTYGEAKDIVLQNAKDSIKRNQDKRGPNIRQPNPVEPHSSMGATYSQILSQSKATRPNEVEVSPPETKSTEV